MISNAEINDRLIEIGITKKNFGDNARFNRVKMTEGLHNGETLIIYKFSVDQAQYIFFRLTDRSIWSVEDSLSPIMTRMIQISKDIEQGPPELDGGYHD